MTTADLAGKERWLWTLSTIAQRLNRRHFLAKSGLSLAALAVDSLLGEERARGATDAEAKGLPDLPHFPARVKRVIYLFQSGAPSQIDPFDHKQTLGGRRGIELPASVRMGQRITTMTSGQKGLPVAPSLFKFAQHGKSGAWLSELLPHTAKIADDLCFIHSMQTGAINHDPAITFVQTGSQLAGRRSFGSWVSYGLGSMKRPPRLRRAPVARADRLTDDERQTLKTWASRPKSTQRLAQRARIVLACAEGLDNKPVAAKLGVCPATVGTWRRRFVERRLEGLADEPRPGAPRKITDADVERVVTRTLETKPKAATHWSTRGMAEAAGPLAVDRRPHLAGLRPEAAPTRDVQAVDRPVSSSRRSATSSACT